MKVLIVSRVILQYRIEFFHLLRDKLKENNITLEIVYGDGSAKSQKDEVPLDFGNFRKNKNIKIGSLNLVWQPCLKEIRSADLVIVEQANRLLLNYLLILRRFLFGKRFAFWGHGLNLQSRKNSIPNLFKRSYSNYTDYWFAYTEGVKSGLIANGFPEEKITAVYNAVDTKKLREYYESIPAREVEELRERLNIKSDEVIFIYCGALYKEKRLDFLVEVGDRLSVEGYSFSILVVGGGESFDYLMEASNTRQWLKVMGPKFGYEKALHFRLSSIFLMPGLIGLAILDSFCMETPMITMKNEFHGPEHEYLIDGYNGIVTNNNIEDYYAGVISLLKAPQKIKELKENCLESSKIYTVEKMAVNFADGIKKALGAG